MASTEDLLERLGVSIDAGTLRLALTHRSYAYEQGGIPTNERLEFLGDSVLGLSVTEALYRDNPDLSEGELAKRRSSVVSTRALAGIARQLGLGEHILLGQGEKLTNGWDKSSILADTMEAVIGATYLSNGIETARGMVMRLIGPVLADAAAMGAGTDWKTNIQEIAAARRMGTIDYKVTGFGPDHARRFEAVLTIGGESFGSGSGRSKKEAEQEAAAVSWKTLCPADADAHTGAADAGAGADADAGAGADADAHTGADADAHTGAGADAHTDAEPLPVRRSAESS